MKYEGYSPHDREGFERMTKLLGTATTEREIDAVMMLYLMDPSYHREDILVARERAVEKLAS